MDKIKFDHKKSKIRDAILGVKEKDVEKLIDKLNDADVDKKSEELELVLNSRVNDATKIAVIYILGLNHGSRGEKQKRFLKGKLRQLLEEVFED